MLEAVLLVFSAGVLTRIADMAADDGLKLSRYTGYATGALYGFLIAYAITHYPLLAELGIAVIAAVLITSKIDHPVHAAGLATAIIFFTVYGIGPLSVPLLAFFMISGALDELGNNLSDSGRIHGLISRFFKYRLTMELAAFTVSCMTGNWMVFLAMVSYDAGFTYAFPASFRTKLIRLSRQR